MSLSSASSAPRTHSDPVDDAELDVLIESVQLGKSNTSRLASSSWIEAPPPPPLPGEGGILPTPPPLRIVRHGFMGPPPPPPLTDDYYERIAPKPKFNRETPFNLLGLPREIRDEIYSHILSRDSLPVIAPGRRNYPPTYKQISISLSIFRVNKQIHCEATECSMGRILL